MNYRITLGLVVACLALAGLVLLLERSGSQASGPSSQQELEVLKFDDSQVRRLVVSKGDQTIQVDRESDGSWTMQPSGERADRVRISSVLARLANLRALRRVGSDGDPSTFGLNPPAIRAKVELENGDVFTLALGQQVPTQSGYYASGQRAGVYYVVGASIYADLERLVQQPPKEVPPPTAVPTP